MVDGAGIGSAMVANKVPGIRAALVNATESYRLSTSDTELFAPRFPWDA